MHPVVRGIIRFYPWVKKFPLPFGFMLLVGGGILGNWLLLTIGGVMIVGRVWELAYQNELALRNQTPNQPSNPPASTTVDTTIDSGR